MTNLEFKMDFQKLIIIFTVIVSPVFGSISETGQHSLQKRSIIDNVMDRLRKDLAVGSNYLNMTSMDPLERDSIAVNINDDDLAIDGDLIDVTINGLSQFHMLQHDHSLLHGEVMMKINYPTISSVGHYDLAYNSESSNAVGEYKIALRDVTFVVHADIKLFSSDGVTINKIDDVNIGKVVLSSNGKYNGKKSNLHITKNTPETATEFCDKHLITDFLIKKTVEFMNERLSGKSLMSLHKYFQSD